MSNRHPSDWIGARIGNYTIQELVGEGTFSFVFKSLDRLTQSERAIKVPKEEAANPEFTRDSHPAGTMAPHEPVPTQVFVKKPDRYSPQEASPYSIHKIQIARTRSVSEQGLVSIDDYSLEKDRVFSVMPLIAGKTFRQYMRSGPVPVAVLRNLALTLQRLNNNQEFGYHGDVKPENMVVTNSGVILVDCGFFGATEYGDTEDDRKSLIVTTPRYYPHLKADDLLAFGLILWEVACRKPLLTGVSYSRDFDLKKASDDLLELVHKEENLGNFHFSQIIKTEKPTQLRGGLPLMVEKILLRAVRLIFTEDDKLDVSPGYDSFEEIADDLRLISQEGIHYL